MKFIQTKNTDDYSILLPADRIGEIVMFDKNECNNREPNYCILIFDKDPKQVTAIGREDFISVRKVRKRFNQLRSELL